MIVDKLERPLRDLRISVTDRCNFRCPYCMPEEIYGERYRFLDRDSVLTFEEIARVARMLVGLGVTKIRLTGGEPLVRNQVDRLVSMLASIDGLSDIAMTSNGYLLAQMAQKLKDAGLQRITVSLDSLDEEIFKQMNGRGFGTQRVIEGIAAAQNDGLAPIKINSVVQRGVNEHTIVDLARFAKERGYIVRFIEYMDVGNLNGWQPTEVVSAEEIVAMIDAEMPLKAVDGNYAGEVASRYAYADGEGEIGVIASVTKPFCTGCTRLRLSPEGSIVTCLFSSSGTDLRGPMRDGATDDELEAIVRGTWGERQDRYSELRSEVAGSPRKKVEMYHIGG
ncbi:MAG: GTP 3',8-cyclase MoaA [SAR202 cluster bacterium]|nr:GTP 3',8-cyclase MoaA [SAR202 cluster bacterium]MDP7225693.1 GTP 3',8-cyclase MoaA [SAR202 cluster bacterium]MDP7414629.1 GTP 3',8-cyclase MoaA [SAR202 cluster bacterium]HJO82415.1 GTP 3',8-cyclase MoaA [SAR202 cluster bacterium]